MVTQNDPNEEKGETTLSQYLHAQFETLIDHQVSIDNKIEFTTAMNNFLSRGTAETMDENSGEYRNPSNMFSPLVTDTHISILPPTSANRPKINPKDAVDIMSGIKLPPIEWQVHLRKGYSILLWVRLHTPARPRVKPSISQKDSSLTEEAQILYRFATSSSTMAHGIQATMYKNNDFIPSDDSKMDESHLPCILRFETLFPPSPQTTIEKTNHSNNAYTKSLTLPVLIPRGRWTLLGVQHSFPYLKKPMLSVNIDGIEVGKGELSYPSIGGDVGGDGIMYDNSVMCNIPSDDIRIFHSRGGSSLLDVEKIDIAGFGLYKESIPSLIQGIICENGPCYAAEGVIPVVPPVAQNRDAIILSGDIHSQTSDKKGANVGPFGIGANPRRSQSSNVRSIGTPLTTGVMLSSDGHYQGEILLQKLLCKLVLGFNTSKSFQASHDRVIIPVAFGSSVGNTADIPKVGITQPKDPYIDISDRKNRAQNQGKINHDDNRCDEQYARCLGTVSIFSTAMQYITQERLLKNRDINLSIPKFHIQTSVDGGTKENLCPNFLLTYANVNTFAYVFQVFRLALPPPGYPHNLQMEHYRNSFDHLYTLVVYNDGALAAQLIQLIASNMLLGGRMREEIIQAGYIHILAVLLRKTLLRALRLGMYDSKAMNSSHSGRLWQRLGSREAPYDDLKDSNSTTHSAPNYIPSSIIDSCCAIISAACGPVQNDSKRWKRSELSFHIRRASDLSLTSIFGFAFDFDLFGRDPNACAAILNEVVCRYCSAGIHVLKSNEMTEKFDSGYGRLLRSEISVEYLLDLIRLRYGEKIILSLSQCSRDAYHSIAVSLSRILYTMLKYSLSSSKSPLLGEIDVKACVHALSDFPLGSMGCHIILTAIRDILTYCELFPNNFNSVIIGSVSRIVQTDAFFRLKKVKSEIASKLGRFLIKGQFHDVIGPVLLSRTVFDSRLGSNENTLFSKENPLDISTAASKTAENIVSVYHWQHHWRLLLHIFLWLCSISGAEGEIAAEAAGALLLHSAQAGTLNRCLSTGDWYGIISILVPQISTESSAVNPGSSYDVSRPIIESHIFDMSNRLKVVIYLLSGFTSCILSNDPSGNVTIEKWSIDVLIIISRTIKEILLYLISAKGENYIVFSARESTHCSHRSTVSDKPDVKVALHVLSHFITSISLLENKRSDLINACHVKETSSFDENDDWKHKLSELEELLEVDDTGDWHLLNDQNIVTISLEDQESIVYDVQKDLLKTTGIIVSRAMIVGGGEASTLVWRSILAAVEYVSSFSVGLKGRIKRDLLCRIVATVLECIISTDRIDDDNPWKSVEICAATARLLDLVEEKQLLIVSDEKRIHSKDTLSSNQIRLLFVLLKCLESGRENTGWCQLVLPNPPSRRGSQEEILPAEHTINSLDIAKGHQTLLNLLRDRNTFKIKLKNKKFKVQYEFDAFDDDTQSDLKKRFLAFQENPPFFAASDSVSSSKMLLPILQPAFRVVLNALENISGSTIVLKNNEEVSLLSLLVPELCATITAALVGLAFSNARDMSLNILSKLRGCMIKKDREEDGPALSAFRSVFMTTIEEIRNRYVGERTKREHASKYAYKNGASDAIAYQYSASSLNEAANASEVERLLIGDQAFQPLKQETDDFLVFPQDSADQEGTNINPKMNSMGWSYYKGFGVALEQCFNFIKQIQQNTSIEEQSDRSLSLLSKYIDSWETYQALNDEESELVDLFDDAISLDTFSSSSACFPNATDTMTTFIEISSSGKSRVNEIQISLLPAQRFNCVNFAETVCWGHYQDVVYNKFSGDIFERCFADGSRDYGSRLVTVPEHPQFSRFIPRQLDHSIGANVEKDNENEIVTGLFRDSSEDLDFDHLNDLLQKSSVKIVDITKKQSSDEQSHSDLEDNLVSKSSLGATEKDQLLDDITYDEDNGGLFLGFPDHENDNGIANTLSNLESEILDRSIETNAAEQVDIDFDFSLSSFSNPPNFSSTFLRGQGGASMCLGGLDGVTDMTFGSCLHIKAEGSRRVTIHLRDTFLFLQYDDIIGLHDGEVQAVEELKKKITMNDDCSKIESTHYDQMIQHYQKLGAMRAKCTRLNISELSHVYLRRYRLRDSALELFFIPSGGTCHDGPGLSSALSSVLLDFGPGRNGNESRDTAAYEIMSRAPIFTVKQWPEKSASFLHEHLKNLTIGWVKGRVTNFDYLLALNCLSGRSFNDLCQYPVFPWVLSNYHSSEIPDLNDRSNYRDLTKPMGALNAQRLEDFLERFNTFDDPVIPPFMYGSHYSTSAGVVLHFLVRLHPFASLHRQLQGGHFDVADRLFSSVSRTWEMCTGHSAAEVKELTPEWYCNPAFLRNTNSFKLGTSQDGEMIGDVQLPLWANGSPEKFIEVMRSALESDICTSMLPDWIDLIFGRKQQGPEAVQANNVFFYLTYYGSCDVASIEDDDLRKATELQIAHFGQCPMQLFWRPHVHKVPLLDPRRRLSLSELFGVYALDVNTSGFDSDLQLPFQHAPISHWVHLAACPPGPHCPLIATRLVFPDRCIAVDAKGIVHFFRWIWRADMEATEKERIERPHNLFSDKGYFVAQRELPNFRRVPRLRYSSKTSATKISVAISKCLFSNSLLVVSDGDGAGGICFQLVDPTKTNIQGEVYVSHVHSGCIRAIQMDSIGAAAGIGGAGGELAIVGSDDGTASIWRFITNDSCCLPLRPRHRISGHSGNRIVSVAINTSLNICATVSAKRCCIFNVSNGQMIRSLLPPSEDTTGIFPNFDSSFVTCDKKFADTTAICITSSGHIILVCESEFTSSKSGIPQRKWNTLELFTLEGIHLGSKALEPWRGVPNKINATFDGRCIFVCCNRGISVHLVSAIKPLCFVDEWYLGGSDETSTNDEDSISLGAYDIDFGPSPSRPIVVCAGLSSGNLRLHALKGISEWSEQYKKGSVNEAVSSVIGTVKGTGSKVAGIVKGTGSRIIGFGKDIGKESLSEVKIKGKGFFGEVFGKSMMNPYAKYTIHSFLNTYISSSKLIIFPFYSNSFRSMKFAAALSILLSLVTAESRYVRSRYTKKEERCELWSSQSKVGKASKSSKSASSKYSFNRISTFQSCLNIDATCNTDSETVAEIVTASADGMTLAYTDSETKSVGFVDIVDPSKPSPLGTIGVGGEPTSISTWGDYVILAVNTSENYVNTSGKLMAIDIQTRSIVKEWDLGGQPDSVAVSADGKYVVVAIENERDEDLGEGIPPQMPAGFVVVVKTFGSTNLDVWEPHVVDVTGLFGADIPEDPEPEFVSINENNIAVVTLQENNALVLIDLETLTVTSSFSAGSINLDGIDTEEEGIIVQTSSLTSVPREPDGVVFMDDNHFVTADEGDMNGGSRGFTVWDVCGNAVYGSGNFMDRYAASIGHYPEERSGNKGVEPENAAFGRFMGTDFLFVNAERANMIFVYDATKPSNPKFIQALPANIGPEGGLTLPDRNLYIVANEKDERGQVRAGLTIYQYGKQKAQYPTLQSVDDKETGAPIPFAALSGLSPDPKDKNVLYAVEDSFFAASRFFKIKTGKSGKPSKIVQAVQINDNDGTFASFVPNGGFGGDSSNDFNQEKLANMINSDLTVNLDSEGIAAVENGDFYIASEGSGTIDDPSRPINSLNFIFKVNNEGTIKKVLSLPAEWNAKQLRFGFEGIAYDHDKNILVVVTQRAWGSDPHPAIHMFDVDTGDHIGYGFYALNSVASQNGGWVGLSDITYVGDGIFYIIERDNQGDIDATIKKIYAININDATSDGHIFEKTLVKDILHITDAIGTTPFEKYEGLAYTNNGVWIVNDNDGVDDARGEIQLMNLGHF